MSRKIRYLTQREKQSTKAMYREIFHEDSDLFVEYYYEHKTLDNKILVLEEAGEYQVMLHLNPFRASLCGETVDLSYIVAVATLPHARRQGKMAQVMRQALKDMYLRHQPFTFLMPKTPPVYYSLGFRFLPENGQAGKRRVAAGCKDIAYRPMRREEAPAAAGFVNEALHAEYDLYLLRDCGYYERLMAETASEGGGVVCIWMDGRLSGVLAYGKEADSVEIKEAVFAAGQEALLETAVKELFPGQTVSMPEMRFMVRILDLKLTGLLLRSKTPFCLRVRVTDDVIEENNGCFEIKAGLEGSSIAVIAEEETDCTMDIGELSGRLFEGVHFFIREWV